MFRKHATPPPTEDTSASPEVPPAPAPTASDPQCSNPDAATSTTTAPVETDGISPASTSALSSLPQQDASETKRNSDKQSHPIPKLSELTLSLESFTNFLLSIDNSAFSNQNDKVWQDMTRPLSEYFISSSHNTYLVGHQLVGVSTIEGYIRALLHSCRSVESKSSICSYAKLLLFQMLMLFFAS